jgi:hypothetical protein
VSNVLPLSARVNLAAHLCDGVGVRATARLCKVSKGAVLRFLVLFGVGCSLLHDKLVRGVEASILEGDEIWSFVWKKDKRKRAGDPDEWGDAYTWTGISVTDRLIVSYLTGKREQYEANAFARDLRSRVVGRPHIATDGFGCYYHAIAAAFGDDVDYGIVIKEYETSIDRQMAAKHRYSPGRVKSIEKKAVYGDPDMDLINTSHMERWNLSTRMEQRRFTRLTNGFSKKQENLCCAVSMHVMHYNFVRPHMGLGGKMTPAMAAGLASRPWTMEELVLAALAAVAEAGAEPDPSDDGGSSPEPGPSPVSPEAPAGPGVARCSPGVDAANDNAAAGAPDDEEAPSTVRDPSPWTGDAAAL